MTHKYFFYLLLLSLLLPSCGKIPIEVLEPPIDSYRVEKGLIKFYPLNGSAKEYVNGVYINNADSISWESSIQFGGERILHYAHLPALYSLSDTISVPNNLQNFTFTFQVNKKRDTVFSPIFNYADKNNQISLYLNDKKIAVQLYHNGKIVIHDFAIESMDSWTFLALGVENHKLYIYTESQIGLLTKWKDASSDRGIPIFADFELQTNGVFSFGNISHTNAFDSDWDDIRLYNRFISASELVFVKTYIE